MDIPQKGDFITFNLANYTFKDRDVNITSRNFI
jgi:hypothetical protein